jgi:hypothetical protein
MLEINNVCSLGYCCHSATILQRLKIKKESYPFDWIKSNLDIIIHCLKDKFKIFLDKSYYKFISHNKCLHSYYNKDKKDNNDNNDNDNENIMFFHYNPIIQKDYEYYKRCVERFNEFLKNKDKKLFVSIVINQTELIDDLNNSIIELDNCLKSHTNNYHILYIYHIVQGIQNHKIIEIKNNIKLLILYTISESKGTKFVVDSDNIYLDKILIYNYKFT